MSETYELDKTFAFIMKTMVETGQAPHYSDVARELKISMEEGRKSVHALFKAGVPGWLYPGGDLIVSFAPFNNLPTQFRITVDGQQKWFGQWAFESLAVSWLFPGKTVQIETPCPDCGEPIRIDMRDGVIEKQEPAGTIGHVSVPFVKWLANVPFAWSTMLFFRSEEHRQRWAQFDPKVKEGHISLTELVQLFSGDYFKRRLASDYMSHIREYGKVFINDLRRIENAGAFWRM